MSVSTARRSSLTSSSLGFGQTQKNASQNEATNWCHIVGMAIICSCLEITGAPIDDFIVTKQQRLYLGATGVHGPIPLKWSWK